MLWPKDLRDSPNQTCATIDDHRRLKGSRDGIGGVVIPRDSTGLYIQGPAWIDGFLYVVLLCSSLFKNGPRNSQASVRPASFACASMLLDRLTYSLTSIHIIHSRTMSEAAVGRQQPFWLWKNRGIHLGVFSFLANAWLSKALCFSELEYKTITSTPRHSLGTSTCSEYAALSQSTQCKYCGFLFGVTMA